VFSTSCAFFRKSLLTTNEAEQLSKNADQDLHYSGVHSLSVEDYNKIRNNLIEFTSKTRKQMMNSHEETLIHLGIDFYEL